MLCPLEIRSIYHAGKILVQKKLVNLVNRELFTKIFLRIYLLNAAATITHVVKLDAATIQGWCLLH